MNLTFDPNVPAPLAEAVWQYVNTYYQNTGWDEHGYDTIHVYGDPAPTNEDADRRWLMWQVPPAPAGCRADWFGIPNQRYLVVGFWSQGGSFAYTEALLVGEDDWVLYTSDGVFDDECTELDGSPAKV